MSAKHFICVLILTYATIAASQDSGQLAVLSASTVPPQTIALTAAKNTPLQIALDKEVRVKKVGQPVHGILMQPLYAFDRMVVPAGAEVKGFVSGIEAISRKMRVLAILNGDLTPAHKVEVQFNQLILPEGKQIPFQAVVTAGSGQVMKLVSMKEDKKRKSAKDVVSEKMDEGKQAAKRPWQEAMKQVKEPGKVHRLERYAIGQLPIRPQYIPSGTLYFAELQEPLDFGSEPVTPQLLASIGDAPAQGSLMHALLVTPLDSATTKNGAEIEAVLAQPLFDGNRLILPQGSRLKGTVVQVRPARRLHHNGQMRVSFRQIIPPDGVAQRVVADLEGVQAARDGHVKLDSEGSAEASTPTTRYLSTTLSLVLATSAFRQHTDADDAGQSQHGVAGGAAGFKLVGLALSAVIKSQTFGMAMGAYGASRSVYSHFISRGRDVVFPRNTAMEIGIGARGRTVLPPPQEEEGPQPAPKHQ